MHISVKTEADRLPAAIDFTKRQIEELDREIRSCDYVEDVNGNLVYMPGSYADEKRGMEHQRRTLEILLSLLTNTTPFTQMDW